MALQNAMLSRAATAVDWRRLDLQRFELAKQRAGVDSEFAGRLSPISLMTAERFGNQKSLHRVERRGAAMFAGRVARRRAEF